MSLYPRLTEKLAAFVRDMSETDAAALSEIRIYCGQPAEFVINERRVRCGEAIGQEDISKLLGALSGIVEPIAGVTGVLIAGSITSIMPWFLAFAAGAMIYVVVEELIPEANLGEHSHTGTLSVMAGFLVMMILDIALA